MISAHPDYLASLRHSHEAVIRVTAYDGATLIGELAPISVQLVIDGTSDIRRSADILVAVDPLDSPTRDALEALSVQSGIIVIEHGITMGGGSLVGGVMVKLATLRIDSIEQSTGDSHRTIRCFDRALLLQEHKFPTPRPLNDTYSSLVGAILQETLPGETLTVDPAVDALLTPVEGKSFERGDDRLARLQELATSVEAWLINDEHGDFHLDVWPETGTSVWDINEGDEGVLVAASEAFSRREQYNAVGVTFSPSNPADDFRGFVYLWDNDPLSPTYYDGDFGKRNIFFDEEYDHLPTAVEAEAVARRKLLEHSGATRSVSLTAIYNPLLLPGDRITVKIPNQASETHVVDLVTINFGDSAVMDIETRLSRPLNTIGGGS